jgi:UDP-N-acetylmuramoyl-tripeptide--D-alanyl-D-alanine ligase
MSIWSISDLVNATGGKIIQNTSRNIDGVSTDTRTDLKDKVFFALRGESFDAHEFAGLAAEKGASVIVIDKDILKITDDVAVIKVEDTLKALQSFATWHRSRFTGKVVGITGSNGKTTTKEFCSTILSQKFPVLSTKGNLNNHVGLPLTLLELRAQHKFAVVEMGMNHEGEIAFLTEMAKPDIVAVTNVGRAHIEFFGSVEKIARAKEELYEHAPKNSVRIYNLDNQYTAMMRARAPGGCKVITFSSYAKDVDISLKEKVLTLDYITVSGHIGKEPGEVKIPSFGRQQVSNAMMASAVALACGVEAPLIWKGLAKCKSGWGRSQVVDLENGAKVLFDAYNANPDSCAMAFENFSLLAARQKKYVVFGDMLELGSHASEYHREAGELMARIDPQAVLLIGNYAEDVKTGLIKAGFNKNIIVSGTYEEKLATSFGAVLETGDVVLVKGSRGMKLERVVELWEPHNLSKT